MKVAINICIDTKRQDLRAFFNPLLLLLTQQPTLPPPPPLSFWFSKQFQQIVSKVQKRLLFEFNDLTINGVMMPIAYTYIDLKFIFCLFAKWKTKCTFWFVSAIFLDSMPPFVVGFDRWLTSTHTYKQPVKRLNIKLSGVHVQIKMHMVKVHQ